jgi:phenylalanyl-tRNA synthetase beta chain
MKVLWSWLLELCDLDRVPTVEEGAAALTRVGLEIEGVTNLGAGFSGVVVAQVVGKRPHPDADKLTLVDVITDRGGTPTQVVCGAPNVPDAGRKVLWAQIGATLPGGLTLAAKAVKGIVSPGMLCAEDELGLSEDHAGIVVLDEDDPTALGQPAQQALGLADFVLEVNAPANRGDVLGHLGVARELCAVLGGRVVMPDADVSMYAGDVGATPTPAIVDPDECARYVARLIDGVKVGPSPRRIAQRLRAVGVRPISNLVDVTNYVMFELGQPLHAFDAATLTSGVIGVSAAGDGEKLTTLDGVDRTLLPGDLLIRDGKRPIALAGVMGGRDTEVTATTTRILLEAASFRAQQIRRTARRLAMHSEASHRFERRVDPELAGFASARAARLLCQVSGGGTVGLPVDSYPKRAPAPAVHVRIARVRQLTGLDLDATACRAALERLGFGVHDGGQALTVMPPSARADVTREADVIEEILRIHGYEHVAPTLPVLRQTQPARARDRGDRVREALAAAGAMEAITFAFQSVDRNAALGLPATDKRSQPIALHNPMSAEQAVMRTSLVPNLLAAVARNQSHGRPDVALFEVGSVFLRRGETVADRPPNELADEPLVVAGVVAGRRAAQLGDGTPYDVFDAKALALAAIRAVAGDVAVKTVATRSIPYLHPGAAGELCVGRDPVGQFGELHPDVRKRLGIDGVVCVFEVELGKLHPAGPAKMRPIAKFPGSARDISLLLADTIPAGRVQDVIAEVGEPLVAGVRLLEDYRDAKLPPGTKSMLWSIAYRAPDRTLTDAEVEAAHEAIVARLSEQLPAQRR